MRSSRYVSAALGLSLVLAGALAASAPALATSPGGPELARGLSPLAGRLPVGPSSQLFGVFCTSPSNCWAVGEASNKGVELNQVLHWTGRHWFKVEVPNPGGTRNGDLSELFAVRCTSSSNCWAVGETQKSDQAELDQAQHWNGRKWVVAPTPTPGGILRSDLNALDDVTCVSARDCWAVGEYGTAININSGVSLNQVLHWNGATWSLVSVPNPDGSANLHGNFLDAVRCVSASDCWAAGAYGAVLATNMTTVRNEMLHWNGKKWAKFTVPNPGGTVKGSINELDGLACASPSDCFAAGLAGTLGSGPSTITLLNDVLRWNGKKWFKQNVPNPGGGGPGSEHILLNATCSSVRNCWAVGLTASLTGQTGPRNEALRWNGTTWSSVKTPDPGGTAMNASNILEAVRCTSAANCWAVGSTAKPSTTNQNEILHWTGKKWFIG